MRNREKELQNFQQQLFNYFIDNEWIIKHIEFHDTTCDHDYWSAFGTCYTKELTSTQDFYITFENETLNLI